MIARSSSAPVSNYKHSKPVVKAAGRVLLRFLVAHTTQPGAAKLVEDQTAVSMATQVNPSQPRERPVMLYYLSTWSDCHCVA